MITNPEVATTAELRSHLERLTLERAAAVASGLSANSLYMEDLEGELDEVHHHYVVLAVSEIASLRAELGDARYG